jgi:lactate permease
VWQQTYDPLGNAVLSTAMAALPVVVLLGLLLLGFSALRSAFAGLAMALVIAVFGFGMPTKLVFSAAVYGGFFGLFPIGWIVFNAVFFYRLTLVTGGFDVLKSSVAMLSPDHRIQALLIAFSFGAFIEGAAGFGTPVAVSAAMLIGLGFPPLLAAGLSLIANTAPVAFGGLGIPIITLAKMVESDPQRIPHVEWALSAMAGRQLPFFAIIVPIWLVAILAGWRGVLGCWPVIMVCGGSFGLIQFLLSNFHGPSAVDVVGGLGSLVCTSVFLYFWKPRSVWRIDGSTPLTNHVVPSTISTQQVVHAWFPWLVMSVLVFLWALPPVKSNLMNWAGRKIPVPFLHEATSRGPEVAHDAKPEKAEYDFFPIAGTGTALFVAAIFAGWWYRMSLSRFTQVLGVALWDMRIALSTIVLMLSLAHVTKYCGSDATMGLAFTKVGWWYPLFAPLLGWLGVALTGSDTASNALFGGLQKITAEKLGLESTLIVASNSTGGVMGKMVDAQSIVVAAVATGQQRQEGSILRFVFPHSLALAFLVGLLTLIQAYWLTWMIPKIPSGG